MQDKREFRTRIAKQFGYALKDPNPNIRFLAIEGLQFLPDCEDSDKVRILFNDPDRFVRWKAFQAAGALRLKSAVPFLLKQLQSFDVFTRSFAIVSLGLIGDPATLPVILDTVRKEDSAKGKLNILRTLRNFGVAVPWDFIHECIKDEDVGVRLETSRLLSVLELTEPCGQAIVALLEREGDTHVFATALLALGKFANPAYLPYFVQSLQHPENRIRANAVESLGFYPFDDRLEKILLPHMTDQANRVKANVIGIFFHNGLDNKVHWEFQKLLNSSNRWERASGAWLAGTYQKSGVVDVLLRHLLDEEAVVAERSAWALGRINQPGTVDALIRAFGKANQWALTNIIKAMEGVAGAKDIPKIKLLFFKERNPLLKAQFIDLFTRLRTEEMLEDIKNLLGEGEHRIRSAAYSFLGTVFPEDHKEILFAGLSDTHHKVRSICAELMLKNGDFRSLKILSESLKEQEKLQKLQTTHTLRELAELLKQG
jgi:HEAT repeat protein